MRIWSSKVTPCTFPYENLPKGGLFIPLRKDFDIDPGRFGEDIVFLTNVGSERQMGPPLRSPG